MTVGDIINFCCQTTGDISSEATSFARDAVRLKYKTLYDAHNWRESMRVLDATPINPALNGIIFLPYDAEEVIYLSISYDGNWFQRLDYRERNWLERFYINIITLPGNIPFYYRDENLAWPYLNPGKFTFTTSDPNTFTVYIEGADANNVMFSESFIISGTTDPTTGNQLPVSISTQNSYSRVTVLSKTDNTLPLTIKDSNGNIFVMPQAMNEIVFTQLRMIPLPAFTQPTWFRSQVKLKADPLDNDMSVPRVSHIWDALIEYTLAALYTKYRQLSKADAREQKATAHVQAAVNVEKNQSEFNQQAVPTQYEYWDYVSVGRGYVSFLRPFG